MVHPVQFQELDISLAVVAEAVTKVVCLVEQEEQAEVVPEQVDLLVLPLLLEQTILVAVEVAEVCLLEILVVEQVVLV